MNVFHCLCISPNKEKKTKVVLCVIPPEKMTRAIAQETQQLETDLNEERSRYQNLLTEHLRLEEKYDDLKEELAHSTVRSAHTPAEAGSHGPDVSTTVPQHA